MTMLIDLDRKCAATQKWEKVSTFRYFVDADAVARLLSKMDGTAYRIRDNRWSNDGVEVTVFTNGEVAA
jgi:hypothetical protein